MSIRARTRRRVILGVSAICLTLAAALAFVFYFMHAVYEPDTIVEEREVPESVRSALRERFPGAGKVTWELEEGLYAAVFQDMDRSQVEVYFTPKGERSRTEVSIRFEDLPRPAQEYLRAKDGYEATEFERIERPAKPVTYEVEIVSTLSEWDIIFDDGGHPISTERDGSVLE